MINMICCKSRDEVVAVIIALVKPQVHAPVATFLDTTPAPRGLDKVLRQKLSLLVKVVARPDVDQDVQFPGMFLDQLCRVVLGPLALVVISKVSCECLFAPIAL